MNNYLASFAMIISMTALSVPAFAVPFSPYDDLTLTVHWDNQYQDLEPEDLVQLSQTSGVKNFRLAFITDSGSCQPAWGGQSAYATSANWGAHLTDQLRAKKIDYTISFGGASGNDLSLACSKSQLVSAYENIIKTYQPQGLDFDIENGTANVKTIMQALQTIQTNHPKLALSFTLPVMPDGLTNTGEDIVKQAQSANLNFAVNIMAMDYGSSFTNDMGDYAVQAATSLQTFLKSIYPNQSDAAIWNRIEVTPMIGVNDVSVEQFTLQDADTLRNFANQNHLHGLAMWAMNRDLPCANSTTSPICSGGNLQTKPYEYAAHFMK